MPNNITGTGVIGARDPITSEMYMSPAFNFTLTEERTTEVAAGYPITDCAPLQDLDVADKQSQYTATMGTQILDRQAINWILFNNKRATSASIELPRLATGLTVTAGSLAVAGLVVDQANVSVVILGDTAPGNIALLPQASGTGVTATTFEVNAGAIAVDPTYDGRQAVVYYRTTETNILTTGGANFEPYQNVELFAKVCGTRFNPIRIWVPRATSLNGLNLDPKADNFSREFRCLLPPGFVVPYVEFEAL